LSGRRPWGPVVCIRLTHLSTEEYPDFLGPSRDFVAGFGTAVVPVSPSSRHARRGEPGFLVGSASRFLGFPTAGSSVAQGSGERGTKPCAESLVHSLPLLGAVRELTVALLRALRPVGSVSSMLAVATTLGVPPSCASPGVMACASLRVDRIHARCARLPISRQTGTSPASLSSSVSMAPVAW